MRNMKKLGALVAAAMLAVMSMTAVAAPSPSAAKVDKVVATVGGKEVTIKETEVAAEVAAKANEIVADKEAVKELTGVTFEKATVAYMKDISIDDLGDGATIRFEIKGVTSSTPVAILHYNGTAWENIKATAGNGYVEGTFTSLSPVAVVVDSAKLVPAESGKTGEGYMTTVIAMVVVAAAAGAYTLKRKESAR